MSPKRLLVLFVVGLMVAILAAALQTVPGYMDAEYYYAGGLRLADGAGFTEPFLWNYLDDPQGLPHPSHTYWMPLPSLVAAGGMILTGSRSFLAARLLFILLAACLPPLTALLAQELRHNPSVSMLAGLLAAFPGFYAVYITNTESFTLYMLLGGLFFWMAVRPMPDRGGRVGLKVLGSGVVVGLMHLTRAEGLVWLLPTALLVGYQILQGEETGGRMAGRFRVLRVVTYLGIMGTGYLLVMAPWYARNLQLYGTLMSPGGSRTLWLTEYDQTFVYPAKTLTSAAWMEMGWRFHTAARWEALLANLKNLLAVQGQVFLLPLIVLGAWRARRNAVIGLAGFIELMLLGLMSGVFPYSGARGGYLHASAALQPLGWVLAADGLEGFIAVGARLRGWKLERAQKLFGSALVALSLLFTTGVYFGVVFGEDLGDPAWERGWKEHVKIETALREWGLNDDTVVMVNNPPGFFVATGRPAIVIPARDARTLGMAAAFYGAEYVALQKDHVVALTALYDSPGDVEGLRYLGDADGVRLFKVEKGSGP